MSWLAKNHWYRSWRLWAFELSRIIFRKHFEKKKNEIFNPSLRHFVPSESLKIYGDTSECRHTVHYIPYNIVYVLYVCVLCYRYYEYNIIIIKVVVLAYGIKIGRPGRPITTRDWLRRNKPANRFQFFIFYFILLYREVRKRIVNYNGSAAYRWTTISDRRAMMTSVRTVATGERFLCSYVCVHIPEVGRLSTVSVLTIWKQKMCIFYHYIIVNS